MDIYKEKFRIHSFHADINGKAQIAAICNWVQEAASGHAEVLGIGTGRLRASGLFWALSRFSVSIDQYPIAGDEIEIQTWISSIRGPFSEREFYIYSQDGNLIGGASTLWFALNEKTRKPQQLGNMGENMPVFPDRKGIKNKPLKIRSLRGTQFLNEIKIRYSDFDINRHVNNVKYIEWIVDSFEIGRFGQQEIAEIDMNFLGETTENEDVIQMFYAEKSETSDYHALRNEKGTEVFRMITTWRNLT